METTVTIETSDERLWQAFKDGKENAFAKIYRNNVKALFRTGHRLTSDSDLIEDCIHDLFIDLWRRRNHLSDITSIKFYLFRALERKLKRKIMQHRKKSDSMASYTNLWELPVEWSWINEQIAAENSKKLKQAIESLSCRQREVLTMHYYEGRNYTEIARVINIKYQSVANLMCQSIRRLREGMQYAQISNDRLATALRSSNGQRVY